MGFDEQENRELWGRPFKATNHEYRAIVDEFNAHPKTLAWRVLHLRVMYGKFDSTDVALCEDLARAECEVEQLATRLIDRHEAQ